MPSESVNRPITEITVSAGIWSSPLTAALKMPGWMERIHLPREKHKDYSNSDPKDLNVGLGYKLY